MTEFTMENLHIEQSFSVSENVIETILQLQLQ